MNAQIGHYLRQSKADFTFVNEIYDQSEQILLMTSQPTRTKTDITSVHITAEQVLVMYIKSININP